MAWEQEPACCMRTRRDACDATRPRAPGHTGYVCQREIQISCRFDVLMSTAILSVTYRISSELRSQATAGLVSTTVGDHVGIRGAVGSLFFAFVALSFFAFVAHFLLVPSFCRFALAFRSVPRPEATVR